MADSREEQAKRNREQFPFAYARLQELQAVFGPDVKISYARQGDLEVGKPLDMTDPRWVSGRDLHPGKLPKVKL